MHPPTAKIQSVCVFCGSGVGVRSEYSLAAAQLGQLLAQRGIRLVYGGGNIGLMGVLADAALAAGGRVVGVIPQVLLAKELAHQGLTELHVVGTMHERKALMADLADAFIALPGGLGTFEELFEALTWAQLGIHAKPVGCWNVGRYFDALTQLLDHAVAEGFLSHQQRQLFVLASEPDELLERLARQQTPTVERWLGKEVI